MHVHVRINFEKDVLMRSDIFTPNQLVHLNSHPRKYEGNWQNKFYSTILLGLPAKDCITPWHSNYVRVSVGIFHGLLTPIASQQMLATACAFR